MRVTIIIPYKVDRGWLIDAVNSVPNDIQLLLSQGEGNWPQNFNKALPKAKGDYIRYLHEDDMLSPNCIEDSIKGLQDADFIHGNAQEMYADAGFYSRPYIPSIKVPSLKDLLQKNVIHSVTTMYRRDVIEKLGGFNEDPKMYSFEEYEFHLRCLKAGFKIGYVNSILGYYRRHPKQIIRTCNIVERKKNRAELLNSYL